MGQRKPPPDWFVMLVGPMIAVIAALGLMLVLGNWLDRFKPHGNEKPAFTPEWTCHSRYNGGYCERTGPRP